ncbi:three component ABC system middle component [Pseudomonas prosekii]|uniref:three component ABC system middle component n=1 Tax=Pseudomonas prosekii TaxID=1148509 RepID=UPI0011EAC2CB|nr:three component ABC system middle component [Pseudomonas prosekii]
MIEEKITLALSPYWLADLIEHFVCGYGKPVPFQLVYLMIPLVLRRDSRDPLLALKNTSTVYSVFLDASEKRRRVLALQLAVDNYSEYTNRAILAYSARGHHFDLNISNAFDYKPKKESYTNHIAKDYFKASRNLGMIFSKEDLAACFYKLGVFKV